MTRLSSAVLVTAALFVLPACGSGGGSTDTSGGVTSTVKQLGAPANSDQEPARLRACTRVQ